MVLKIGDTTVIDADNFPAGKVSQNVTVFSSSGTFTVPSGVTSIHALVFGGGGGGSAGTSVNGGYGGYLHKRDIQVTSSTNISITVGTGGTLSNTTAGNAGGASSFTVDGTTYQANGGNAGAGATNGTGSNGDVNSNVSDFNTSKLLFNRFPMSLAAFINNDQRLLFEENKYSTRVGNSNSAGWGGFNASNLPGARGLGETSNGSENSIGGEGGAVILYY
jgi:hypothetical protein